MGRLHLPHCFDQAVPTGNFAVPLRGSPGFLQQSASAMDFFLLTILYVLKPKLLHFFGKLEKVFSSANIKRLFDLCNFTQSSEEIAFPPTTARLLTFPQEIVYFLTNKSAYPALKRGAETPGNADFSCFPSPQYNSSGQLKKGKFPLLELVFVSQVCFYFNFHFFHLS